MFSSKIRVKWLDEISMREVTLYTEKSEFIPGEEISGHVVVTTDKSFTCNRVTLKLTGLEYTHYQAGKVHVSETHDVLGEELILWEGGNIHSGDTRFEFRYTLPEGIPPSHNGLFGEISYSAEAVVEVDRARDPKSKIDLNILAPQPPHIPEPLDQEPIREEREHIIGELPTNIIRPPKGLVVRFLVRERSRIKGVRLDIVKHEEVMCQGRNLDSMSETNQRHICIPVRQRLVAHLYYPNDWHKGSQIPKPTNSKIRRSSHHPNC